MTKIKKIKEIKLYKLKQSTNSLIYAKIDKLRNDVRDMEEKNNHIRYKLAYQKIWLAINPIVEINIRINNCAPTLK